MRDEFIEDQEIVSDDPTNFTMIPNMVTKELMKVSRYAMCLYLWYKMVCSEKGRCWIKLSNMSVATGMKRHTIIKARRILEEMNLIETKHVRNEDGSPRVVITIRNIWRENAAYHAKCPNGHSANGCIDNRVPKTAPRPSAQNGTQIRH